MILIFIDLFLPHEKTDRQENYRSINIKNELLDFDIPENFSFPLIEDLIQTNPNDTDTEIAFKIIKAYRQEIDKSKIKATKQIKLKPNYQKGDLRKCDAEEPSTLHQQLIDLNVIAKLQDYMI